MMRTMALLTGMLLAPAFLAAQNRLPVGTTATATLPASGTATFAFTAPGAGVLTITVDGRDDLSIAVLDADGQPLPDGMADGDLDGNVGHELSALQLTEAGDYRVEIRTFGGEGGGSFTIGSGFIAMPGFARPGDPDGRPSQAMTLPVGEARDEVLSPDTGDHRDWFRLQATEAGTLVVLTRVADDFEGDLVLEAFMGGDFAEPLTRSDQDLQGNAGRESLTLEVAVGDVVHVRISSVFGSGEGLAYRISAGQMP